MRVDLIEKHSFLADHLSAHSRVVDLGANEGRFALEIIRRYGCYVLGVEPLPELASAMPKHNRFVVESAAITDGDDLVVIHINPTTCASVGIARAGSSPLTVPGVTLGQLFERHRIERVALLKIDIEGAEIALFQSAADSDLLRIDQISVEYHDYIEPRLTDSVRTADTRLRALGFQKFAFSLDNSDVLYLHPRLRVRAVKKAAIIVFYKYGRGFARRVRRYTRR